MIGNYYPRIYGLSTIGIKQHFNCNYRFHPIRTDFSGESGSGKSMVADFIQLILVGSGVYKSSTESNKSREPKGMVVKPKERQHGIGYIFLNIETGFEKYIVIGAYIESSHNKVQPFIIQGGYDWEHKLTPLSQPTRYQYLLIKDKIVVVEELQELLIEVGLKTLSRGRYHQLLFDNQILALDLNKRATLESYASILRSFSRGKGFKTDSESLKKFIFGNDDQNQLLQKYQEEIKAINDDFHEHKRYIEEIELINKKQTEIEGLISLNKLYQTKHTDYLVSKNWYWKNLFGLFDTEYNQKKIQYDTINNDLGVIELKIIELEIQKIETDINTFSKLKELRSSLLNAEKEHHNSISNFEILEKRLNKLKQKKDQINIVCKWMELNDNNLEDVRRWYVDEIKKLKDKEILKGFINHLNKFGQLDTFEQSEWRVDFDAKKKKYDQQIQKIEIEINKLKSLSTFTDINNKDSLAGWAIKNLDFPISHEVESVLVHFQNLPHKTPNPKIENRYLPFPEFLFEKLKIKNKLEFGFWIDLDGVYEFIEYVPTRYLNVSKPDEIIKILSGLNKGIQEKLADLKKDRDRQLKIKEVLFDFSGLDKAVLLYQRKEKVLSAKPNIDLGITKERFENYLDIFKNRKKILEDFETSKKNYETAISSKATHLSKIKELNEQIEKHELKISNKELTEQHLVNELNEKRDTLLKESESLKNKITKYTSIDKIRKKMIPNKFDIVSALKLKIEKERRIGNISQEMQSVKNKLEETKNKLNEAQQEYIHVFRTEFKFEKGKEINIIQDPEKGINSLRSQFEKLKTRFETKYDSIRDSLEDKSQLIGYSVGTLAHKLLPTVFLSSKIDEDLRQFKINS